ncbi:obscurin-like isoform X3 [Macrosteles quadrilineatus]|uniref:obscurin-like isoform X3 n=1 Tax=Macrosteles quadrilineatus TaxID=74068 RepID=UPI0023E1C94B|nr:obscurin-like isoform X3 [Macrosteles quadrilineatus]
MSTFCRITGRSRGLPKPNYFPLLPPISPADAKRFCRITGKSYGLPAHHYIPVLVSTKPKKKAAQAPIPLIGQENGIQTKSHVLVADYRYVFPVCEDSSDLVQLLDGKNIESKAHYIYKVAERRCSLVFSAKMEAAVRDGDIRNVMLAKDSDTLLLKLRKGGDVAIDVRDISIEGLDIYDGEGPSEEVVNQRKKRKRKENSVMSTVGKIFEEKERVAEIEEEKDKKKQKVLKKESANDVSKAKTDVKRQKWNDVKPEPLDIVVTASSEELSPLFENNNWSNFDETFQNKGRPVVDKMPSPCVLEPEVVDLSTSLPGLIQAPAVLDSTTGLEVVSAVNPISPLIVEPDLELQNCIKKLDSSELEKTADAKQVFSRDKHNLNMLPTILEIPELLEHLKEGTHSTIGSSQCQVSGLKLDIHTASKFIVGVTVETPNGPVFVPGQTVNTPNGEQFVPGITIKTPEGVPQLLPGQIFDVKDESGMKQPVFVAGQVLNTREGETFVPGQKVETKDGPKFVPGQTIMTEDSLKFVPGQIIRSEGHEEPQFVPGITELDCDGHKFVPGQMHTDQYGQISFVPGQSELAEEGWNFVPGQSVTTSTGDVKFVPGQVVNSKDGPTFIPGQTVKTKFGDNQFVPGVVVEGEEGTKFVPGAAIKTADGPQFVEGQLFRSSSGKMHFIPGVTEVSEEGTFEFAAARHVSDIVTRDSSSLGISIQNAVINTTDKSDTVYGHMVQTRQGVEFFPGVASGLPAGKVVPGRLVRGKEVKFVPGVMIDDKFVPGQVVTTENGEQFVPGQVVETKDGAKFVPGQVIDTRSGPKFVPGQTVETPEGPKFVPGQIVETKAGPTFIPGQVISTDDGGSRFVPGQVVETIEGPRFVPGRVVETGDKVSFVPGQVVETSEGLKFIAPDLENDSQGDVQFTVQGFEITPEELSLLRPQINTNSIFAPTSSEMSIDSRMMRQLSEAGMAVGKQVPAEVPKVDVRTVPAMGVACSLRDRLPGNIDPVTTIKLSQILAAVADFDCTIPINGSEIVDTPKEGIILKAMMKAAAQADTELALYKNVCAVLEKALLLEDRDEIIPIVDNLHKFVLHSPKLELMRPKKKMQVLKDVIVGNVSSEQEIIDKLSYILKDGEASVLEGFKNFTKGCPEIVGKIVQRMTDTLDKIENEKDASESLQKAIIEVVRESSDISIHNVLNNATGDNVKNMFLEAIGLARAMGMREVASTLLCVLADPRKAELLVNDRVTFEILRRLTVMRHLAEKRPKFGTALLQLKTDPDEARSDPLVRELVRESGALMIIPEETKIQSAGDIPISLIANNNSLAMEDFMLKNKKHGILVIVKHGIQCVIPREACRAVLTGKVPYTVLDERGMHTFAPLHVFSALHIPQMYTHRFSMYSVSTEEEAPTLGTITPASAASVEDVSTLHSSQHKDTADKEGGDVIFSANQDYLSSDLDSLSLHRGEQVIVLDTVGGNLSTAKQSELDADLNLGGEVTSLLDNSAARHKLAVRPRKRYTGSRHRDISPSVPEQQRWLVQSIEDPGRQGWVPATVLSTHEDSPDDMKPNDAKFNRDVVVRELIETEEEFGRDIQQVIDAYLKPLDSPSVPRVVRDNKDVIFGNLKKISEFHNTTLIEGLRYYAEQPKMLGKTFLRLERDFDKHVAYCRDEPAAQDFFLDNDEARDYFEELSQQLGDDKSLSEHLKLPVQRINDYQLLLRELVKYSTRLGEDTTDLGKALELMLAVPHRANDNKFISNIEGYHGNIHKLGRLLRHDWFCVTDRDGKSKERYLFLFKARILICKVRRISEDRSVFVLKDIIRLPEVEVKDHKEDPKVYELHHKQPDFGSYPLKLAAHKDRIKDAWLAEIRQYATDVLALAEHAADDLRLQPSVENKRLEPLQGIHIEPATPDQVIPLEPRDSEAKPQKSVLPKRYSPEAEKKPKEEKVEEKPEPQKPKAVEKQEEPKKIEPAKPPEPSGEKRKEEEPDLPVDKKVKFEEQEMDSHSSSISRRASTRKVVSTEEYRSVSSSQEVYMESSSTRSSTSAGMSSSRSMKIIEESASVNGRTVASSREVIGGGSGYSAIQEVSSGGVTIEEISSKQGSSRLDERRRSSGPKPVFTKTIEGMRVQPGGNAFFECELDEKAKVIWLKDNKPLEDKWADRITAVSSDTKHRLEIKGAHENDTGLYTARAEDNRGVSSCTARLLVEHFTESQGKAGGSKEPEFTISLHDTELLENTYLRFMVKVRGDPKPDVKFYKNDRLITVANERIEIIKTNADKGYYELVIPDVQQEDAGTYKCIASNIHGEVESEGVVTVTDDKKLFEGLEDAELLQPGEQPNFTWLRDGKPFDPEDRFKVLFKDEEDSLALVFQHVKPEDAGLYTCVASTSTGKISCSAELTVQGSVNQLMREPQKPKLSTEVKKTESAIGGTAMLELKVEGFPKPDVKWSHDGKDITAGGRYKFLHDVEEESMSLVIKNVEASDAGDYKITASNELGEDHDTVHLMVKAPPKFKTKLSDVSCMASAEIKLKVQVEGCPQPDVKWYKDGKVITKSDCIKTYNEADATYELVIDKASLDDAGAYSVVATNELSQTSEFCKVEVHSPPEFIKTMTKHIETSEGDTVTFQVKVRGDPMPSVKWLKDGVVLKSDGSHIQISEDGATHTLVVHGINRKDTGKYSCEISNTHGTTRDDGDMFVKCCPQFRQKLSDQKANEGDTNIEFTVNIEAFPKPQVKWFHNEVEITEKKTEFTRIEEGDNYKLIIKEVTTELSGKYSVKVVNDLGKEESTSKFTVYSKPRFSKPLPSEIKVDEGASLTLQIEVEGTPDPAVKWYKNGQEVTGDAHIKISRDSQRVENYNMTFTLVKVADGGEYEVRASNEMGTSVTKTTVLVQTQTSMMEGDATEAQQTPEPAKKAETEEVEKPKPQAAKTATTEEAVDEVVEEKKAKTDIVEEPTRGTRDEIEEVTPKEQEKPKTVEVEGGAIPQKVSIEDVGDEERDIFENDIAKVGSFSCVELKVENENDELVNGSCLIEEFSESDDRGMRLSISRNVSIVSLSDDDRQTPLPKDTPERENAQLFTFEDQESVEVASNKGTEEGILKKRGMSIVDEVVKAHQVSEENLDKPQSRRASLLQKENKTVEDSCTAKEVKEDDLGSRKKSLTAKRISFEEREQTSSNDAEDKKSKITPVDPTRKGVLSEQNLEEELTISRKTSVERRESFSKVNVTNVSISRRSSQSLICNEINKAEVFDSVQSIPNSLEREETSSNNVEDKKSKITPVDTTRNGVLSEQNLEEEQTISRKTSVERRESFSKVDVTNVSISRRSSQSLICNEINKAEVFDSVQSIPNGLEITKESCEFQESGFELNGKGLNSIEMQSPSKALKVDSGNSVDSNGLSSNTETPKEIKQESLQEAELKDDEDTTGDSKTDELIKRIKKQRSILEELIDKEEEQGFEAAPEILSADMNDRTVYESLSTVFEVEAKGVPRPEAKWYKENEELKVDDHTKISEQGQKYRLELRNIKVADAGYYKCKVVNRLGEKVQTAQLSVLTEAALREPKFKTPLKPQEVPKGQDVTFTAVVTGDPIPEVKWTKDGEDISVRFTLASTDKEVKDGLKECTFTLKIPAGRHEDTGEYKVTAFNKWGSADSSARLDMVFRPEIICYKDTTCTPYEQVELIANILANPRPNITWLAGNKVVKDDEHSVMDNNTKDEVYKLILKNVGVDDENVYTVKASNNVGESEAKAKLTVHTEKPSLLKQLDGQTIKDYHPVEFKIRAIGIPKPQISWYKDDKKLVSDGHIVIEDATEGQACSTLSIGHFCHADVGQYTVKAANLAGEAESSASLKMAQIPPSFSKTLDRSIDLAEADPLELRAKVDGSPMPQVKWLKDGEPLEPSDRVKISVAPDGSVKLNIDSVKPTDCGAYKLMAINENGESSSICAVAVAPEARQPQFTKGLTDTAAVEGEPLRLEAQVAAFPTPEVKWTKDGHPVRPSPHVIMSTTPAGVLTLAIDKVKPEDAGTYEVAVSNRLGDTSSNAKVDVKQKEKKPQFLAQLQPVTVVEGFPAKMEVKVVGHPPPTIAWSLNGKPLVPDGKHVKIVDGPDGSQTLLIDNATPADAGTYSVTVKNPQGEVTSQAPLSVTARAKTDAPEQAPSLPKGLRDAVADEDSPLVFSAPFLGNPVPGVVWSKDGTPLQSGDRVAITCDGNKIGLEINPCKPEDAGTYSVMLTNPLGEVKEEAKGTVRKIYQRPLFTQKFNDLQQLPNYDAKLMARVTGTPKPDVTWYKGDTRLSDSDKYRLKRDGDAVYLYVQDCCLDDSGVYKCVATNREGEDTCQAELEVVDKLERKPKAEPPVFLKKIGDCEVFKGMTAKFTACAMGYPEPEAEWFRGNDKLFPSERIRMEREGTGLLRLSIIGVDPALDVGQYKCRIYNPHGEETCDAHMIYDSLDVRPRKPIGEQYVDFDKFQKTGAPLPLSDRPIISRMTDRRLTLSWKPSIPIGPRDPVTYQVEMCELPSGEWFTARTGVRSCACDIANLEPFRDYKFRIRVENKYGVSDPSPFAQTYRQKLEPDPPKFIPYLPPGIDFRPETSPYFPKDFDIERPPHDGYAQAPKFLRQEHDCQYGVKNHNCNLFWFVYGYPKPKMTYFFNDEPIEMGGRYDSSYTRNGQATLFINKMLERDVGMYEAVATNEHGMARQRVRLEIAEYPEFLQRPDETIVMVRRSGRIEARVIGVPYPEIKWYKDWQPLASSSRIKMLQHLINIFPGSGQSSENSGNGKIQHIEPDLCILIINDAITKDEGLYSISARNIAGSVSSSVMVRVEESESDYGYLTYGKGRNVKPKIKPLGEFYDLGDELGRGTQGITYHSVERLSGRNYAAKIMHGKGELRGFMRNELEMMNMLNHRKLIRLYDAYESPHTFTLVTEIAAGGELLYNLTKQTFVTESEIAGYIRQILWGLEHMHDQNIAHLGLTPGDLLISHPGGDDLKICDFGLARRIAYNRLASLEYGMPEFVAPEIVKGEGVSFPADMWSVGVITHLLLTGISLFRGQDDRTTLTNIKENKWEFREDIWKYLSIEARDFITKLLVFDAEGRMDVKAALRHPWLNSADKMPSNQHSITTDTLRNYYNLLKDWYANASCRTWYRRMPLDGAFTHPSRMVYPPGRAYTPDPTPPPEQTSKAGTPRTWEDQIPSRKPLDYELCAVKSESHYQNGPDTYLLQLRDVDFPVRLREYMKVAAERCPLSRGNYHDRDNPHVDWRTPVIRERRRFTDVMDEEIDDERKERINRYGSPDMHTLRRIRHELGTRLDSHVEAEALMAARRDGMAPFFREKPQTLPVEEDKPAELVCFAVGDPRPVVQWFKNDMVLTESHRIKIQEDDFGRSILRFNPAHASDIGIYKVTARNKSGQTVVRCRVVLAETPHAPDSPDASDISDTEILLRWKQPKCDGNSPVVCYSVQCKESDAVDWIDLASNIDHEFYLVRDLKPNTSYQFRLASKNKIGWSEKGIPTKAIKTSEPGVPKIQMSRAMKHLQDIVESGQEVVHEEQKSHLEYKVEKNPIHWSHDQPTEKYNYISEISRGRFSVVVKGIDKSNDRVVVAKLLEYRPDTEVAVDAEFEAYRSLRHERIACLIEAYKPSNAQVAVFIEEKLQGVDVLTYLSNRHEYTEQTVANIITQVLDGLQYLHWRGFCHLDLQPDNVVMLSVRSVQVKLVDFGATQRVSKIGTVVKSLGHPEFTAPEVLSEEAAYPQTDIWSVGVLTYVLLSGVSPFRGANKDETRQNINFVRFRFEHLYKELTQEATRFIMLVFKRHPHKRPTAEECHEHRWLLPTEYMIKRRERAVFLGNRLKEYSEQYHNEKATEITKFESLTSAVRSLGPNVTRSNSIVEEILSI